jgi:hypothetical protein
MAGMAAGTTHWIARCLICTGLMLPFQVSAQQVPEYDLKAAFVYNFALFTNWPPGTSFEGNSLNLCFHPSSPLRDAFAGLTGKLVNGRKIVLRQPVTTDEFAACHVLFTGSVDRDRWPQVRQALAGAAVLTVSDDEEIGHAGSIVTLVMEGQRVVFDIDLQAARPTRLVLSSKLLRLARKVQ